MAKHSEPTKKSEPVPVRADPIPIPGPDPIPVPIPVQPSINLRLDFPSIEHTLQRRQFTVVDSDNPATTIYSKDYPPDATFDSFQVPSNVSTVLVTMTDRFLDNSTKIHTLKLSIPDNQVLGTTRISHEITRLP